MIRLIAQAEYKIIAPCKLIELNTTELPIGIKKIKSLQLINVL